MLLIISYSRILIQHIAVTPNLKIIWSNTSNNLILFFANVSDDVAEGSEDTMKLVSNYVDQLEVDLDKDRLKVMIKEMYIEAQDSNIPIK